MSKQYTLIVFDWDGTLMDSAAKIVSAMQSAIADTGLPYRNGAEIREIIGLGLAEAIHALFGDIEFVDQQRLVDRYRYYFVEGDQTPMPLFAGVEELLTELNALGYQLGIATGKSRRGLQRVLDEHGLGHHFHATRTADETRSKPHPQMLEEVMELIGAGTHETLMIGDTEYDMLMARNAGTHALGVSYGVHEKERLLACGAKGCLNDVRDLLSWLGH